MEKHAQNIEFYLQNGGDIKIANRHRLPTLENRARISYLISNFPKNFQEVSKTIASEKVRELPRQMLDTVGQTLDNPVPEISKPKALGIIAQYPVELHPTYKKAFELWVNICSLKIQLNAIPRQDERASFEIQTDIIQQIEIFDRCKSALDHYNEHKRILVIETKSDFSELSPMEVLTKRNSLRGLITRRKQTIKKMESELPDKSAKDYYKKISALNRKKEQLQELILDEEKLNELIK